MAVSPNQDRVGLGEPLGWTKCPRGGRGVRRCVSLL